MLDMTDRIEYEDRTVEVLKRDAEAALARWRRKGWVHVHSSYGGKAGRGLLTVKLHLQRPKGAVKR